MESVVRLLLMDLLPIIMVMFRFMTLLVTPGQSLAMILLEYLLVMELV